MHMTRSITTALERYPQATFLDIGANIGSHSLVVASLGRKVVAIEPKLATVMRLHKSVNLNHLRSELTLVKNAISNKRGPLTLYSDNVNQGGSSVVFKFGNKETIQTILFDDLLEVLPDTLEVVIKIDIEGSETRALINSTQFFSKIKVQAIFMEWMQIKPFFEDSDEIDLIDRQLAIDMVARLRAEGFEPRDVDPAFGFDTHKPLLDSEMASWPNDVAWIRLWPGIAFAEQ